ncbi:MAG: metallophosphoesterase family protein [Hyphomicrobiales bacterium]
MIVALFADIHANLDAFEACLRHARQRRLDRMAILGDLVGYGADPGPVTDMVRELLATGAVVLKGNHDAAIGSTRESMNAAARAAIDWTRLQLSDEQKRWLDRLPFTTEEDDRLYVHASPRTPAHWIYIRGPEDAADGLKATDARIVFCGHVHVPQVFGLSATGKITSFKPVTGTPVPLLPHRRWLTVLGAVGQPRDGDPRACYATFDTDLSELTLHRVPYDIDAAARKILRAGLPEFLAQRLFIGH